MSFSYPGSAGGQPRLTLPFMQLNPDDPQFASKFQSIMRTLMTWGNSLFLPASSGAVLAWTRAHATISTSTTPVTWTIDFQSPFVYWDGSIQKIAQLPDNSLTMFLYGFANSTSNVPSSDNPLLYLQLLDNGGVHQVGPSAAWQDQLTGTTPSHWWQTPTTSYIADSDNLVEALPWEWEADAENVGNQVVFVHIVSWSKA